MKLDKAHVRTFDQHLADDAAVPIALRVLHVRLVPQGQFTHPAPRSVAERLRSFRRVDAGPPNNVPAALFIAQSERVPVGNGDYLTRQRGAKRQARHREPAP